MWELPQITILRTSSKVLGTYTFRKFFLVFLPRTHVILKFCESSHTLSFYVKIRLHKDKVKVLATTQIYKKQTVQNSEFKDRTVSKLRMSSL
ncbi:hypothetical protein BRAT_14640 [Leptospira interrogans serovar Bratislava]|uniref:Uncharacterized protein n=2 Tax=Leptospira interrogans TaxID=173 RepID=M3E7B6_LEPIR|nr:hypothetical protein BRAT_14640 [Leptospira interrogans serovar Bratislava]ALE38280.1 hypothetical protein G436_1072 [Leptospira interrogans serovar Hardjo str. Norma]EMF42795.1 hypothetical protein LEP1GSC067_4313 [Leptospira interrogans serovar Lora str. TE 1992]KWV24520.1 hypothetical protein LA733_1956 [Leptospira interrogans]KWV27032.1 hypothetical protein LA702_2017 [Leptospira interrogans]